MRAVIDRDTGFLELLYHELGSAQGEITDILHTSDQLCDRAGCHCAGAEMICSIEGTRFYNAAINAVFHDQCASRCRCVEEILTDPDTDSTWSPADSAWSSDGESDYDDYSDDSIHDHWAHNIAVIRANYANGRARDPIDDQSSQTCVPNRLQECETCLAGPSAGWTLNSADCCPDYSLETITPQEAFTQFAMPISTLVSNHISVGVCMPTG